MQWKTAITKITDQGEIIRGHNLHELIREKSFVEVIFLLLRGEMPSAKETRMLNALFTACIDHGVGTPSATVARMVASTGNSLHTSLAAGIQTMGELHGGAIEGAAKFFQENKNSNPESLVKELKEKKVRIPGYGHRVLSKDHRSVALFEVATETGFNGNHCTFALAVEDALNKISSKPLPLNIDGAMAAVLSDMGFDWKMTRGFFIIGRVPGLVAQVYEQMMSGEGMKRLGE